MQLQIATIDPDKNHFNLDKDHSDLTLNQYALNTIVGTLVKYGPSGKLEPSLAESWTVSKDKKIWQFKIRDNLYCEDELPITADIFKKNFQKNLKEYSKKGSVIMFDHLVGWSNFINNTSEDITGLKVKNNILEMQFEENPDDLLELLRMPYFGLWREDDNHKLISSGPYSLKSLTEKVILLSLRENWFTSTKDSFKEVEISFVKLNENILNVSSKSIVRIPYFFEENENQKNGYWIKSPPTVLETFALSPYKNNFFHHLENRQIFKARINKLYPDLIKSNSFYSSSKTEFPIDNNVNYKKIFTGIKITFSSEKATHSKEELLYLNKIISYALEGSGATYEIVPHNPDDANWIGNVTGNNFYDARISTVDIGGYPQYMTLKMMFCTKMGVSFPDSSGKICNLVSEGIKNNKPIDQIFIDNFNYIIHQEAIIIPVRHHSGKWLVSNDLDPSTLPATTLYPQFELIRSR